jgi:tetratricopeptide (TPR) repeat protein
MSADRISQLHEQASEHYLNGDYTAALASWREVLALDPGNEAAREGARMASQFSQEQAPVAGAAGATAPDLEHDVELGLKVLDSLGSKAPGPPTFDLGDPSQTDAAPVMAPIEEGWEPPAAEDVGFGLAPAPATVESPAAPTAAGLELRRRVDDLLAQARAKVEAGERDEALAILARVSILDEENAEAAAIRAQMEASGKTDLDRVEQAIIEGVSALESARLDDAERLFQEALNITPEHREALHYLEQVATRRAAAAAPSEPPVEDLLGSGDPFGDLPAAPPSEPAAIPIASKARASRALPPSMPEPQRPARTGRKLPSLKVLLIAGFGGIAVVCAVMAVPMWLDRGTTPPPASPARTSAPRPAAAQGAVANPGPSTATPAGAERAAAVSRTLEKAKRLTDAGDFAGAVVAYNEAITLDPANLDARAGLASAGAHYRAEKADQDALKAIESAFAGGEYATGLRLAYRLPATVDVARIEKVKLAGWYNLAIVALRAGDCRAALGNLDEVLTLAPDDPEARKLKDFATRYADIPKDRAFLDTAEALPFRPFP